MTLEDSTTFTNFAFRSEPYIDTNGKRDRKSPGEIKHPSEVLKTLGPEDREILVKAGKNGLDPGGFGESGERWSSTVYSVLGNL